MNDAPLNYTNEAGRSVTSAAAFRSGYKYGVASVYLEENDGNEQEVGRQYHQQRCGCS